MATEDNSILVIGESGVGKTHYGAQLLSRLMKGDGQLRMDGAAQNLQPFEAALERLNEGMAAGHTATAVYFDSVWPIISAEGRKADLVWPDYGGEQIRAMAAKRRIPVTWCSRVRTAPAWLLLVRLNQMRTEDDIFIRPLRELRAARPQTQAPVTGEHDPAELSDQARLIELMQMLLHVRGETVEEPLRRPRLAVLLTCWDELGVDGLPRDLLQKRLPMLSDFIASTWAESSVLGLSSLGKSLSPKNPDSDYISLGPDHFGFVILPDGSQSPDLTLPISQLLAGHL